jgi:protein-tyrosine phosphatase
MPVQAEWHVEVEGCLNFRDAGGWATDSGERMRTGALYRSDDPVRLTGAGRRAVEALGLAAVVDLRQQSQFDRGPGFVGRERTVHVPLVDRVIDPENPPTIVAPSDLADLYEAMLDRSEPQLAKALDAIARYVTEGPVLVHCAFGKDRAGLVTALIQAAIGLSSETISADYTRSDEPCGRRRTWMLAEPLPDDPVSTKAPPYLFTAPAAAMTDLLTRMVARHGSLQAWPAALPIAADTIDRLRDRLLER